jgi:hypothetical protein
MILLVIILLIDRGRLLERGSVTPIFYAFALSCSSTYLLANSRLYAWLGWLFMVRVFDIGLASMVSPLENLDAVKGNLNGMSGTPHV